MGGGMRQAGVIAAAGLVALRTAWSSGWPRTTGGRRGWPGRWPSAGPTAGASRRRSDQHRHLPPRSTCAPAWTTSLGGCAGRHRRPAGGAPDDPSRCRRRGDRAGGQGAVGRAVAAAPSPTLARMAELVRDAPASVLAVYAHPDDPEVSCGGTLARWTAAGAEVHTVVCTSGDKGSSDPATDPAELVARRAEEVAAAASLVGLAGHHLLGHPDGELENRSNLRRELVALIRAGAARRSSCAPTPRRCCSVRTTTTTWTTGWSDGPPSTPSPRPLALPLYFPETGPPHQVEVVYLSGTLEPDVWVDVSRHVGRSSSRRCCATAASCPRRASGSAP